MYVIKNALRCIGRAKGRNILIGVIVLVIAISSCIGLSIRQAAESAKADALELMNVTATISFDRGAAMSQMAGGLGGFDRGYFSDIMGASSSLSLEEYLIYAQAQSVEDFYYSMSVYVNGADGFTPVSADVEEETENGDSIQAGMPGGFGGMMGGGNRVFGLNSDFAVVGYSGENAMTSFLNGTAAMTQGSVFTAGAADGACIITEELAAFNDLSVGDPIQISNPNNGEELYTLTVAGLYSDSSANESSFSMLGSTSSDPVNRICVSYATLEGIVADSQAAVAAMEEETGAVALSGTLTGTYVFADAEDYETFEPEARALGLDDMYTVNSSDVASFEAGLVPLNTLSTMAGYFLVVILAIGAVILVVLNIFNVRERKYEIGVLTAMGMKKGKVALQFLTESFIVTLVAIIIGVGVGGVSSVPVTNALLENQVASQNQQSQQIQQNFGREYIGGNRFANGAGYQNFFSSMLGTDAETAYVTEIGSAMNLTVVLQMLAIGIVLTLAAGTVSMLFVMRYDPLKILANRD